MALEIKRNPQASAALLAAFDASKWGKIEDSTKWVYIENQISLPFQNSMRIELLLKTMRDTLRNSAYPEAEVQLNHLLEEFVVPELGYINDNYELLIQLKEIEALVQRVGDIKFASKAAIKFNEEAAVSMQVEAAEIRQYLRRERAHLARGKADVLTVLSGLVCLLKDFHKNIHHLLEMERKAYLVLAYKNLADTVNWPALYLADMKLLPVPADDPHEVLGATIKKLELQCGQIAAVRSIEQFGIRINPRLTRKNNEGLKIFAQLDRIKEEMQMLAGMNFSQLPLSSVLPISVLTSQSPPAIVNAVQAVLIYIGGALEELTHKGVEAEKWLEELYRLLEVLYGEVDKHLEKEKQAYLNVAAKKVGNVINWSASLFVDTTSFHIPVNDPRPMLRELMESLKPYFEVLIDVDVNESSPEVDLKHSPPRPL